MYKNLCIKSFIMILIRFTFQINILGEVFRISVQGEAHAVSIELEKQTVRFLDTYNTMNRQQTFKITNKSDHLLTYMCMKNESVYDGTVRKDYSIRLRTIRSYIINLISSSPTATASRSLCHPTRPIVHL